MGHRSPNRRRLPRWLALTLLSLAALPPAPALAKADEVRVAGVCGRGASAELRLLGDEGAIELRFRVAHNRPGALWRVVLVQERRIAWRGAARTSRSSGSFEVRRSLRDLPGADAVTARAWGPQGLVCRASATLD